MKTLSMILLSYPKQQKLNIQALPLTWEDINRVPQPFHPMQWYRHMGLYQIRMTADYPTSICAEQEPMTLVEKINSWAKSARWDMPFLDQSLMLSPYKLINPRYLLHPHCHQIPTNQKFHHDRFKTNYNLMTMIQLHLDEDSIATTLRVTTSLNTPTYYQHQLDWTYTNQTPPNTNTITYHTPSADRCKQILKYQQKEQGSQSRKRPAIPSSQEETSSKQPPLPVITLPTITAVARRNCQSSLESNNKN